ncbi:MAG: GntR family transcriptional regulator [Lawsonibacter sp.]
MLETSSMDGVFPAQEQIKTTTYKQQAYELIKSAILYQKLKPDAIYSQESICQALNISRTPVREALLELQKEGYILFYRGKGIQIVSLDEQAIHDILEMRIYQETAAAELAGKRATPEDLAYIGERLEEHRRSLDSQDIDRCYRLDHQFHRAIARAAHNDFLYRTIDDVLDHYLCFEALSIYKSYIGANAIWEEHSVLYNALREHDPEKARRVAEVHLQNAYERTLGKYWKK